MLLILPDVASPHQSTSTLPALTSRTIARALHAHYTTTPAPLHLLSALALFASLLSSPSQTTRQELTTRRHHPNPSASRLVFPPSTTRSAAFNRTTMTHDHDGTTALLPSILFLRRSHILDPLISIMHLRLHHLQFHPAIPPCNSTTLQLHSASLPESLLVISLHVHIFTLLSTASPLDVPTSDILFPVS
jgi:hypothetical protein